MQVPEPACIRIDIIISYNQKMWKKMMHTQAVYTACV